VTDTVALFCALGIAPAIECADEIAGYAAYAFERYGLKLVIQVDKIAVDSDVQAFDRAAGMSRTNVRKIV